MSFLHAGKIAAGLIAMSALTNVAHAQYYPGPYGQQQYRDYRDDWVYRQRQRRDPGYICEQKGGDLWRMPSKEFNAVDVRPAGRGNVVVTLSVRKRIAYCTVDRFGNVIDFR